MQVVAFYQNYPNQIAGTASFPVAINLMLGPELGALSTINRRPEFSLPPTEIKYYLEYGQAWRLDLGEIYDAEDDAVSVSLNCINAENTFLEIVSDETGFYHLEIQAKNTT